MKRNRKYVFLTAKELVEKLLYGTKKEYDFTFDDAESISGGYEPTSWFGVKLMNLFDNHLPDSLAVGYWGGGDTKLFNLEWDEERADHVTKTERLEEIMTKYLSEYFAENEAVVACVEL